MAYIEERSGKRGTKYRALVRMKGHPPISATFDRKTDAKLWARKTEADLQAGRYFPESQSRKHTADEMIERYIRTVMPHKSPSTQASQISQLEWWKNRLGRFRLSDVTPSLIADARDHLQSSETRRGQLPSPSTVVRYMAVLSHCFAIAVREWRWLDDNPVRMVSRPREPSGRIRYLSDNERDQLLDMCRKSHNAILYPVVILAISTGMRRGEILNLTWDRVDFERRVITLLSADTKNREARGVPLVGFAHEVLQRYSETQRTVSTLVFPAPTDNGQKSKPADIRPAWDKAVKLAGLDDFRFHDLRHTAASYLAMNGATSAEIAEVLGHKTLAMVKRYSHLTASHTSSVVERMNKKMFGTGDED